MRRIRKREWRSAESAFLPLLAGRAKKYGEIFAGVTRLSSERSLERPLSRILSAFAALAVNRARLNAIRNDRG